jgi:hypothetical protein
MEKVLDERKRRHHVVVSEKDREWKKALENSDAKPASDSNLKSLVQKLKVKAVKPNSIGRRK